MPVLKGKAANPFLNEVRNGLIICTKCEEWKSFDGFSIDVTLKRGFCSWCRDCVAERARQRRATLTPQQKEEHYSKYREKNKLALRKHREENPDIGAQYARKYRYGITQEQFLSMLEQQNYVCKVCHNPPSGNGSSGKSLHIDHDHSCCPGKSSCGKCIRGLVCWTCNIVLGLVKDNQVLLNELAEYLNVNRK